MELDKIAYAIYDARCRAGVISTPSADRSLANKICECAAEIAAINDNRSADPVQQLYLFLKAVTALPSSDPQS